eukprot:TRINITY_DN16218_c0_g1_i1.p1 TRINITY_DN16218_c0_g1~~TRINITY_DN16218_c0_g1_i1.p1  ORF type:complete len:219 (-),score=40.62 TRINITY_DN16218_c0_g1_i1:381-1037(-)
MGQKSSKGREEVVSDLEKRMVAAVIARHKDPNRKVPPSFDAVALKFPVINKAFSEVREVFNKFDVDKSKTIDLEEMKSCFKDLHFQIPEGEVHAYFKESDMDGSGNIEFREFVVIIALSYLLAPPSSNGALSPQLQKAVESIVDAFMFCDKDGSGYVSKDEITNSFAETCGNLRRPSGGVRSVIGPRWLEMDWDANGTVSFKEFLFAFADWVGADEED